MRAQWLAVERIAASLDTSGATWTSTAATRSSALAARSASVSAEVRASQSSSDPDCYCAANVLGFSCAASAGELCQQPPVKPTWQCEFCGRFYSERTAKDHGYCIQAEDRRNAERAGAFDV
jgi:hypothetical protein